MFSNWNVPRKDAVEVFSGCANGDFGYIDKSTQYEYEKWKSKKGLSSLETHI